MTSVRSCYRLCTFDVTHTLLKFKEPVGEQYAKVGRIYGVEREPSQITAAFVHHWNIMNSKFPNYGCNAGLTSKEWWRRLVHETFTFDGKEISGKHLDRISNHLYDIYKNNVCWEVVPGAVSLLKRLKEENISLGVISNFDERLQSVLCAHDLNSYFDFVLASYVFQVAKPDKRIFDLALSKCPRVSSTEALHIGDDVKLDYQAAKNAGWNAALIFDKKKGNLPTDVNFSEVIENIAEIESLVFRT